MRVFLDGILSIIGSESLTDIEFDTVTITSQTYSLATYQQLKSILESREMVSGQLWKLKSFFKIKGVALEGDRPIKAQSNIFIGARLGC